MAEVTITKTFPKRTAIVTGSARGIGKAIAVRLAEDGYDVCINDISSSQPDIDKVVEEIKALGRAAMGYAADVTKQAEVEAMVAASVAQLGPLDLMVANAGIVQVKSVLEISDADLKGIFDVNVFGVFNCYRAAATQMIKHGNGGKIVGACSVAGYKTVPHLSHYCATKYAVRAFTQAFATELGPHQITVNAYAPGIVSTDMWDVIDHGLAERTATTPGAARQKFVGDLVALGRQSVPDDVARCVSYLAGPDSAYMTGQTLVIDGGMIMM